MFPSTGNKYSPNLYISSKWRLLQSKRGDAKRTCIGQVLTNLLMIWLRQMVLVVSWWFKVQLCAVEVISFNVLDISATFCLGLYLPCEGTVKVGDVQIQAWIPWFLCWHCTSYEWKVSCSDRVFWSVWRNLVRKNEHRVFFPLHHNHPFASLEPQPFFFNNKLCFLKSFLISWTSVGVSLPVYYPSFYERSHNKYALVSWSGWATKWRVCLFEWCELGRYTSDKRQNNCEHVTAWTSLISCKH